MESLSLRRKIPVLPTGEPPMDAPGSFHSSMLYMTKKTQ